MLGDNKHAFRIIFGSGFLGGPICQINFCRDLVQLCLQKGLNVFCVGWNSIPLILGNFLAGTGGDRG